MSARRWVLDAERSSLRVAFTGAEGGPVRGSFATWSATLTLDPEALAGAKVEVRVATESIDTGDVRRDEMLRGSLFLDAAHHRIVGFSGRRVVHARDARWRLLGDLTIKDSTVPLLVDVAWGGVEAESRGAARAACSARCSFDPGRFGLGPALGSSGSAAQGPVEIIAELEFVEHR